MLLNEFRSQRCLRSTEVVSDNPALKVLTVLVPGKLLLFCIDPS
jgi:hypothetical protein